MTSEKIEEHRVLGRLVARELTEGELMNVSGGDDSAPSINTGCSPTTANGCTHGDSACD